MKWKKKTIGWVEWVALPEFDVSKIKAKMDTGARTSALHAEYIRVFTDAQGAHWVSFTVFAKKSKKHSHRITVPLKESRLVKSSNGGTTLRPVISTLLRLGNIERKIEVTLINRDPMEYRMILGRKALEGFLIDPSLQRTLKVSNKEKI